MRRRAQLLALALASAGLALAVGELAVRGLGIGPVIRVENRWLYQRSDDPALGYELRPGAPDGVLWISQAGLRDRDFPPAKPAGTLRIAVVGDSVAYGAGVSRHEAFARRLEQRLEQCARPDGPRFEVMNFGVTGYGVSQVAQVVRARALPYAPDVIVYGYVLNDPQDFSLEGASIDWRERRDAGRSPSGSWLRWLARSRLFLLAWVQVAGVRSDAGRAPRREDDPTYAASAQGGVQDHFRRLHADPEAARRLRDGLAALADATRGANAAVLVAIFPLFGDEGALAAVRGGVAEQARRLGLEVLDLAPVYALARERLDEEIEIDFLHPNALGHRIAAEALLARLCAGEPPLAPVGSLDCASRLQGDTPEARLARALEGGP
jgi:lysophospholipase L1-like esterase